MAHVFLTAGPTREYLDPVRYLSNASSGRMACAIAGHLVACGHQVTIASGPVSVVYPDGCQVIPVTTTQEMLDVALRHVSSVQGIFGVAAPCDFRPRHFQDSKIKKEASQEIVEIAFEKTPDILLSLAREIAQMPAGDRPWMVGFALETEDGIRNAIQKRHRKKCQYIVMNHAEVIESHNTGLTIIGPDDQIALEIQDSKINAAEKLVDLVLQELS